MRRRWEPSDEAELAEMAALAASYAGPVTRCPPGIARGHKGRRNAREDEAPDAPDSDAPPRETGGSL